MSEISARDMFNEGYTTSVAEQGARADIGVGDAAPGVDGDEGVVGVLDQRPQEGLRAFQCGDGAHALGELHRLT